MTRGQAKRELQGMIMRRARRTDDERDSAVAGRTFKRVGGPIPLLTMDCLPENGRQLWRLSLELFPGEELEYGSNHAKQRYNIPALDGRMPCKNDE